ncbi:MAG: 30S ribosomal protein S12 methylthiotransferase RimO, partial [Parasporobacterium sp.]|nr:30S ribosomal protein S12 methylthiotransferase RimO [Parasporobacterium sp.]
PGETEEDHQILKDFVSDIKFDRLGVFTYSREEGTKAYSMKGQITKKIKEKRRSEIMKLQEKIMLSKAEERLSKTFDIITDGYIPEDDIYVGRSFMDAPDVDGLVYFKSEDNLLTGDMVKVLVTGANQYDMYGEMEDFL